MRIRDLPGAVALVVACAACGDGTEVGRDSPPAPTAVNCADAAGLRQRAVDDRGRSEESKSDQERISIGNRANFLASLAIIADLKCKVTLAAADEALKPAFDAARKAETSNSMYERAFRWGQADFIAAQVIAVLIQQLPAAASK
jgi:hypothetical protein